MTIAQRPVDELAKEMESRRKGLDLLRNDDEKKAAQQAYQQELTRLGREAAARMAACGPSTRRRSCASR